MIELKNSVLLENLDRGSMVHGKLLYLYRAMYAVG